jgi:CTP synthase (UTP-ammonia lyase)
MERLLAAAGAFEWQTARRHFASQFHPEFQSKPHQPHPLFKGFIAAAHQRIHLKPL